MKGQKQTVADVKIISRCIYRANGCHFPFSMWFLFGCFSCWRETLLGLSGLVTHRSLNSSQCEIVVRNIFDHVAVQSMTQSGRKLALDILLQFVRKQPDELIQLGEYTIAGMIRSIDGEKDPRNLLVTFQLASFLLCCGSNGVGLSTPSSKRFQADLLEQYLEEIFELTSCYFPITFHPPKNDPIGITGADLQQGLRKVFISHPGLAEFVLPLMIEKLESSVIECKLDVLETLRYCIESGSYAISDLDPFLDPLWKSLKKEMFQGSTDHDGVIMAASRTFSALVRVLCPDQVGGFAAFDIAPSWNLLMGPIMAEIREELKMPDSKQARSYATLLQLICATSANAFIRSMKELFSSAIESKFYSVHVQPTQRVALLQLLNLLITAAQQEYPYPLPHHPLQPYVESMMSMMSSVLMDGSEQRAIAIEGMAKIVVIPPFTTIPSTAHATSADNAASTNMDVDHGNTNTIVGSSKPIPQRLLPIDQVRALVQTLTDRYITDEDESVRDCALTGLVTISRDTRYCPLLLKFTLPALFNPTTLALLPSSSSSSSSSAASQPKSDLDRMAATARTPTLEDVLFAASSLCTASSLLSATLPYLLNMVQTHFIGALQGDFARVGAIIMILGCLSEIITSNASTAEGRIRLECCVTSLPNALIGMLVNGSLLLTKVNPEFALDSSVITLSVTSLQTIVRVANAEAQQTIGDQIVKLFIDGNVEPYVQSALPVPSDVDFTPFTISLSASHVVLTSKSQLQLVPLFTAAIGSMRTSVRIDRISEVIRRLGWFIDRYGDSGESEKDAHQSAIECLAAILNKLPIADPILNEFIQQHLVEQLLNQIVDEKVDIKKRLLASNVIIWVRRIRKQSRHGSTVI